MPKEYQLPRKPSFSKLPLLENGLRGNAWGLFPEKDELGLLNYITPEITYAATKEIVHGIRIQTDLPLNFFKTPDYNRLPFQHEVKNVNDWAVNDDILTMNTQSSSQWDGFRHFGYQGHKRYYNDRTQEDIHSTREIGIDAWVENGGIATRGVLLDYARWASYKGLSRPLFEATSINARDLHEVAASQGVTLRQGDVLMVRSGYLAGYNNLSEEERTARAKQPFPPSIGLESSEETLRFLWESDVVAVAGDMPALEAWPWQDEKFWLHEWLLAGWGCPIGEFFNLEKLASECERLRKWTFFFSSMPLNIPGGAASPPNGMAIL